MRTAALLTALLLAGLAAGTAFGDLLPPAPTVSTPTVTSPIPVPTLPAPTVPAVTTTVTVPPPPPPAPAPAPVHVTTPTVQVSAPTAQQPVPSASVSGGSSVAVGGVTAGTSSGGTATGALRTGSIGTSSSVGPAGGTTAAGGTSGPAVAGPTGGPGWSTAVAFAASARSGRRSVTINRLRAARPWIATSGPASHRKTTLSFKLRRRARVLFTVTQLAPQCRIAGRFVVDGHRGLNKVRFTGRLGGRPLQPGTYRISAQAWGGATILQVILVVVDFAPSPTELEHARSENVCASSSSARALASNAMLASGGAAGGTGSGASQGAASEIVRSQTSGAAAPANSDHRSAAPFSTARISGNAMRPLVLASLAIAILLLGVAALPRQAIPDPRVTDVLTRHRLEIALAGLGALAAAMVSLALA